MELHKNWHVSENKLAELKSMEREALNKLIESKGLTNGLPTKKANEIKKAIYGKIDPKPVKRKAKKVDASKDKTGDRKDN